MLLLPLFIQTLIHQLWLSVLAKGTLACGGFKKNLLFRLNS